jgi:hypothetical protein
MQIHEQKWTLVTDESCFDLLGRTYWKVYKDSDFGLQPSKMSCTLVDEYQCGSVDV